MRLSLLKMDHDAPDAGGARARDGAGAADAGDPCTCTAEADVKQKQGAHGAGPVHVARPHLLL